MIFLMRFSHVFIHPRGITMAAATIRVPPQPHRQYNGRQNHLSFTTVVPSYLGYKVRSKLYLDHVACRHVYYGTIIIIGPMNLVGSG